MLVRTVELSSNGLRRSMVSLSLRKKSRVAVVEAKSIATAAGEVAVVIEQRESVAVLENARRLIDQRIVRGDVKRLRDFLRFVAVRISGHEPQAAALPSRRATKRR